MPAQVKYFLAAALLSVQSRFRDRAVSLVYIDGSEGNLVPKPIYLALNWRRFSLKVSAEREESARYPGFPAEFRESGAA